MFNVTKYFTAIAIAPLIMLTAATSSAQDDSLSEKEVFEKYFENWYQVEIIAFERIEQASDEAEAWPKNLELVYPVNLEFLSEPQHEQPALEESLENTDPDANRELLEALKRGGSSDPLNKKLLSRIEKAELERLTPKERPFIFLSEDQRALNREKTTLARDRAMRILFHEAWRQPMLDRENAPSIVLTGGDLFDQNYELEGSIKLFVSRYLHIYTNLWLTRFEANIGQDAGHWPQVPPRPEPFSLSEQDWPEGDSSFGESASPAFEALSLDSETDTSDEINFSIRQDGFIEDKTSPSFYDTIGSVGYEREFRPFIAAHIVTLRQKRRMRSDELHYIDHPKMGLLIKITKYDPTYQDKENNDQKD